MKAMSGKQLNDLSREVQTALVALINEKIPNRPEELPEHIFADRLSLAKAVAQRAWDHVCEMNNCDPRRPTDCRQSDGVYVYLSQDEADVVA